MAGYYNYSMSNNAKQAYADGEKPLSKWTKSEILDCLPSEKAEIASKLTADELRRFCLRKSSWHHMSLYYNRTDFYEFDEDNADELTAEQIERIIANRLPKVRTAKAVESSPLFVTAFVRYEEWEGTRKHPKKVEKTDFVQFMSNAKMIKCYNSNNYEKRLSSVKIVCKIEQKTKFATVEQLKKKFKLK